MGPWTRPQRKKQKWFRAWGPVFRGLEPGVGCRGLRFRPSCLGLRLEGLGTIFGYYSACNVRLQTS